MNGATINTDMEQSPRYVIKPKEQGAALRIYDKLPFVLKDYTRIRAHVSRPRLEGHKRLLLITASGKGNRKPRGRVER